MKKSIIVLSIFLLGLSFTGKSLSCPEIKATPTATPTPEPTETANLNNQL